MYSKKHLKYPSNYLWSVRCCVAAIVFVAIVLLFAAPGWRSPGSGSESGAQTQSQPTRSQQDQMPAEAGGPGGEVGPIAVPKKKDTEEAPPPPKPKQPADIPQFSLHVDVPVVTVDAQRVAEGRASAVALPLTWPRNTSRSGKTACRRRSRA